MNYIYNKITGRFFSLLFLFIISCNSSKKIIIEKKIKSDIKNYYITKKINIDDVLFLNSFENYKKLDSINFTTIPDIFIFDKKGNLINFNENDKNECVNKPIVFLKNINKKVFKYDKTIVLENYLKLFDINKEVNYFLNNNNIEYFVFINTSTFTDNLNQIRFLDSKKIEDNTKKVFFVNLDLLNEWFNK